MVALLQHGCYISGVGSSHGQVALDRWPALVALALVGFIAAVSGTYWDDAWHTQEGRDSFLIAPHVLLYTGITLAGTALGLWGALAVRALGLRNALQHQPLLLGMAGVALTLAAAPIDNGWHEAFGRDAVIWSPPHMLGIAGSLLIASALLLELGPRASRRHEVAVALVTGAAVVAVAALPVLEYETDVPQFDLALYLPVLATGTAFAFGLVRLALPLAWPATPTALAYTVLVAAVAAVLAGSGLPAPLLPLLAVPALGLDLVRSQRLWVQALVFSGLLFLAYVPYLNWVRSDIYLDWGQIALGLPLAAAGSLLALAATTPRPRRWGKIAALAAVATALLVPGAALAHDPGQGTELTTASVRAQVRGGEARFFVAPSNHCRDLAPQQLVARRAGDTRQAPLARVGECAFAGAIELPDRGRWFVYAELAHDADQVEAWLPVKAGATETVVDQDRSLYLPPTVEDSWGKVAAGVVIYLLLAAALVAVAIVYRRRLGAVA